MASGFTNDSMNIREASQQKRKQARTPLSLTGDFTLEGSQQAHTCLITDLGTGGLSIQSKTTLYDGDKVVVRVRLQGKLISIVAGVARVSGKNIGLTFSNLAEEDMASIQEYIHVNFFSQDKKNT